VKSAGLGALLLLLLGASPGAAQGFFSLDLSGGATRHQFAEPGTALSLAPRFGWRGNGARLDAGFTYTRGATMQWNAEGGARAALQRPLGSKLLFAVAAGGWWTAHRIGEGTSLLDLRPSLRMATPGRGELVLEAGAGRSSTTSGGRWFGLLGARGRWLVGPFEVVGQVHHTRFNQGTMRWGSVWLYPGSDTLRGPDTLSTLRQYSDVGLSLGWMLKGTRLELAVEQRIGRQEFRATGWHLEASRPLGPSLGVFASGGQTLSALAAGLPARRYTALGIRWAPGRANPHRATPDNRHTLRLEPQPDATTRVMVRAGDATSVDIMGDFTDWEPVALLPEGDGWWALPRALPRGLYRMNLRSDGGMWRVPPGLSSEADDFGGRVGVLLVK
jgi:hypothetical protein